ncbi:M23 family metallopeptidase, partial [Candidatus Dojkabacteria bacterium]|nr:M23 family metallopeptidase [Candidatus Dojkabacteria bacterium]
GEALAVSYGNVGNLDLLQQGGSLNTVLAVDAENANYKVFTHVVLNGETLQQIADQYGVSKDTVKWANPKLLSPFNDNVTMGATLSIPEINGVLHKIESGDTLDSIVALTAGNRFDIIELNELVPPDYSLAGKEYIFVPNGRIIPPPPPPPVPYIVRLPSGGACIEHGVPVQPLGSFPLGTFTDPLCSPQCQGYSWQRGFSSWHNGADLSKGGGCPIRAAAAGTVTYAGWKGYGSGYTVIIDHGNGAETQYLHGDGNIWVRPGDYVYKGQDIMFMGTTGNSTGIHLHFTLKYGGVSIDPAPYVPYLR